MSGMLMSSRIRSGGSCCAASRASLPLGTGRTLYPRSLSMPASTWRLAGVSSTIRMLAGWPAVSGVAISNGGSCAEKIKKLLILEAFGEAAQFPGDARIAPLYRFNPCQKLVQIRGDDGLAHGVDELVRPTRDRLGRELRRLLRLLGGSLCVIVFHADLGMNLAKELGFPEGLADEVVRPDRKQLLAVLVQRAGGDGHD